MKRRIIITEDSSHTKYSSNEPDLSFYPWGYPGIDACVYQDTVTCQTPLRCQTTLWLFEMGFGTGAEERNAESNKGRRLGAFIKQR